MVQKGFLQDSQAEKGTQTSLLSYAQLEIPNHRDAENRKSKIYKCGPAFRRCQLRDQNRSGLDTHLKALRRDGWLYLDSSRYPP